MVRVSVSPQTYCVETLIPKVALGGGAFVGD